MMSFVVLSHGTIKKSCIHGRMFQYRIALFLEAKREVLSIMIKYNKEKQYVSSKNKILFISHGLGNGGAEHASSIIASELAKIGCNILFLAVYNDMVTYELHDDVKYKYLNVDTNNKVRKYLKRVSGIKKVLDNFQPDWVISFITQEVLPLHFLGKYRIIYSERTNPAAKPWYLRMITFASYSLSYQVVFQTEWARSYFSKYIQKKSSIIANPVVDNLPIWDPGNNSKVIITAGRISPEKNHKMLIKAFALFHKKHPDYHLKIYGKPIYKEAKEELIKLTNELNVGEYVEFPGFSNDIYLIMQNAAIFVLTSNFEGLSNSMLEAMAIGIPTICTDCPAYGAREYIDDGKNGFLVKMNDYDTLAFKMSFLVDNKDMAQSIHNESIKIRNVIDKETVISQWMKILEQND